MTDTADTTAAPALAVQLLGTAAWRRGAGPVVPLSRKDAALLALLLLQSQALRAPLGTLLWPEVTPAQALSNLRQRLFRLRRATSHSIVLAAGELLQPAPGLELDVLQPRVDDSSHDAPLLGQFDYGDCEALDQWVANERQRHTQARVEQLAAQAAQLEGQGDWSAALALVQRLLALAPLREHGWRQWMRLHRHRGDRAAGLAAFDRLERLLKDELGGRPSAETLAELQALEQLQAFTPGPGAPASDSHTPQALPPVVGRDAQCSAMARAWAEGRAFVLLGGAGLGKSRLLAEFTRGLAGVLAERGRPGDERTPYASLRRLLLPLVQGGLPADPWARRELARLLPQAGPAPRGAGQQPALWQAVETVLEEALSQGWTTLIHDDLQFTDPATRELLRWLLASPKLQGWRVAFAARPLESPGAAGLAQDWVSDSSRLVPVALTPLDEAGVAALVESLPAHGLDAAALAAPLHRHAGGNPYFTLETLKEMKRQAAIEHRLPAPATVAALLDQRLQGLPADARALLRVAAVAGTELTVERAATMLGNRALELAGPWAQLEAAGVLQGTQFAHDLVHEAAVRDVPAALRQALHASLARLLVQDGSVPPARVAEHWWAANEFAAAARAWRAAAHDARQAGRLVEQLALLDRAIEAHEHADDPVQAVATALEQMPSTIVHHGSRAALDRLPALLARAGNNGQRLALRLVEVEALVNLCDYEPAGALAAELAPQTVEHPGLHATALALQGRVLALQGRPEEAMPLLAQAHAHALQLGDERQALVAVTALAHARFATGQVAQAVQTQRDAQALAAALGDVAELAATTANLATTYFYLGDTGNAYVQAGEAARALRAMGSAGATHGGVNHVVLGRAAAHLGHLDEAREALQLAGQALGPAAGATAAAMACTAGAALDIWLGDAQAAISRLGDCPVQAQPISQAAWHLVRASAQLALGSLVDADLRALDIVLQAQPALATDPLLLLERSRHGPAAPAVDVLRKVRLQCRANGRDGMARSLHIREIDRLRELDPAAAQAAARELWPQIDQGWYAATFAPAALGLLAQVLAAAGEGTAAAALRREAADWLHRAAGQLASTSVRQRFLAQHAALLGSLQ